MELVDLIRPDGTRTGAVKPKHEVHRDGDLHLAAHLWIVTPDRRVVLQRRSDTKENFPSLWDISVAGHVGAGESSLDAIVREAFEELGLRLDPASLALLGSAPYHAVLNGGTYVENEIHDIYLARIDIDVALLRLDPVEVAGVAVVHPDELASFEMVPHPASHEFLREALARLA
jgi:isopentenyl-diphosphate delta-isomerase